MFQILVKGDGVEAKIHWLGQIHKGVAESCLDNFVDHYRSVGTECTVILEEVKEVHTVTVCKTIPKMD